MRDNTGNIEQEPEVAEIKIGIVKTWRIRLKYKWNRWFGCKYQDACHFHVSQFHLDDNKKPCVSCLSCGRTNFSRDDGDDNSEKLPKEILEQQYEAYEQLKFERRKEEINKLADVIRNQPYISHNIVPPIDFPFSEPGDGIITPKFWDTNSLDEQAANSNLNAGTFKSDSEGNMKYKFWKQTSKALHIDPLDMEPADLPVDSTTPPFFPVSPSDRIEWEIKEKQRIQQYQIGMDVQYTKAFGPKLPDQSLSADQIHAPSNQEIEDNNLSLFLGHNDPVISHELTAIFHKLADIKRMHDIQIIALQVDSETQLRWRNRLGLDASLYYERYPVRQDYNCSGIAFWDVCVDSMLKQRVLIPVVLPNSLPDMMNRIYGDQ